jgi:hypothetical protein
MRCPIHGPVDDEEATICPMKLRRTIAGETAEGICGQPLVGDDGAPVPEYPADEDDEGN